jgi:hypothetical protein
MDKKTVFFICATFIIGVSIGRFTSPKKVITKTETQVVTKEVVKWKVKKDTQVNKDKEVVIVETKYPDGTIKTEKRIIDKGKITVQLDKHGQATTNTNIISNTTSVKEYNTNNLLISGMISPDIRSSTLRYGLLVQKRLIGPIFIGGFGVLNSGVGVTIGLSF